MVMRVAAELRREEEGKLQVLASSPGAKKEGGGVSDGEVKLSSSSGEGKGGFASMGQLAERAQALRAKVQDMEDA